MFVKQSVVKNAEQELIEEKYLTTDWGLFNYNSVTN